MCSLAAQGFGMQVRHYDPGKGDEKLSQAVGFEELLRISDIVSVHVPVTPVPAQLVGQLP
ncbi:NAD(P)-dependent oxidoreductase [Kutzneria buriramensis]|uniref:D-3-phosphoglycerate dehydrogenase/D-lactate dehydrogenase n=1 Tax=Kutzneria buriramensis TaxID=1045776 RepID=A0A3E0GWA5_9PSEU|nr:NAD(P)-dependent oxidoreductase [Kutzneria buriramensis]REH28616.1 D-3-phosphoglycerate dehydrogenase/D-lactate dehydrogenase [Kutzneria buriramensis]